MRCQPVRSESARSRYQPTVARIVRGDSRRRDEGGPREGADVVVTNPPFAGDVEYTEQAKAIRLFVGQVNAAGGINGRMINPIITYFDPASESAMRALCKDTSTWMSTTPPARMAGSSR